MPVAGDNRPRQVVPRWRPAWVTARLGLTESSRKKAESKLPPTTALERRRREWLENRDIPHAADLLSTAFGMGMGKEAHDAAEFVLQANVGVPRPLAAVARRIVAGDASLPIAPVDVDHLGRYQRINRLKHRLREWPRDALARVDLAREYTILGQRDKALEPIVTALALAPVSSFVIRSAARFFLNYGDPDRALFVVRRAPRLVSDPWLLAAEIAVSGAAERTSRFTRPARSMILSGKFAPKHTSELAGALGTMELKSGNRRGARRLFRAALEAPTENTLAQAEWVCSELPELELEVASRASERSYEAMARVSLGQERWRAVVENAKLWRLDEPFATRSAHFGSCAALVVVEDFQGALEFADFGLATKPRDSLLLNNKAVALALMDRPSDAAKLLTQIEAIGNSDSQWTPVHLATTGLVQFRLGEPESGRKWYERAREETGRSKKLREEAWTLLFQAREEARIDMQRAQDLISTAQAVIQRLSHKDAHVAQRLLTLVTPTSDTVKKLSASSCANSG